MSRPDSEFSARSSAGEAFAQRLRDKWREVPGGVSRRVFASELLALSDAELLAVWERHRRETSAPEVRGWYQERYREVLRGKRVLDFGAGFSVDGIHFAEQGAALTFADIVEENLAVLKRITELKGLPGEFYFIDDFFSFNFPHRFDVMLFLGSIHNAPFEFARREVQAVLNFLEIGGMALVLAYPKERYVESGARSFEEFGRMTDGERTPWCEWYDDDKMMNLFGPRVDLRWSQNFGLSKTDFNWFELVRVK
jgi:SAM-dependent methyltransferase